jgi:tetratricopeptide (TPR) repeat protein
MSPLRLAFLLALAPLLCCATAQKAPTPSASPLEAALAEGQKAQQEGKGDLAIAAFRRARSIDPRSTAAMRAYVEAHYRSGRKDEIVRELEPASTSSPDDDVLHYGLGLALFARSADGLDKALEHLTRASALKPDVAEYHFRVGVVNLEAERFPDAVTSLKRARDLDPAQARHHVPLALALARTGDRKGAIEAIRAILALSPDKRDIDVAQKVMARITDPFREFPKAIEPDFQRGLEALEKLDAPQAAIVAFEEILEKFPDLAVVHAALGLSFYRLDDTSRAMDEFRRALELAPEDARNHLYLADLYFSKDRLDRAAEEYRAALERDPLSDRAYDRLGAIAQQRNNPAEAAGFLRTLVVLRPDDNQARYNWGMALLADGQLDAAAREFTAVLSREPKNVEVLLRLALVEVERSRREKDPGLANAARERAVKQLEQVLDIQPENVFAAQTLQKLRPP